MVSYIGDRVHDYSLVMLQNMKFFERNQVVSLIRCCPPRKSYVKLNVDGSCGDKGLSGCRGIIQDTKGIWVMVSPSL